MAGQRVIGYMVRGTTRDGQAIPARDTPCGDLAAAQRGVFFHEARGSSVRIFAVGENGAETMLPTYEDALAERSRVLNMTEAFTYAEEPGAMDVAARVGMVLESREAIARERDGALAEIERLRGVTDRLEHACPDCGKDARVDHEGME